MFLYEGMPIGNITSITGLDLLDVSKVTAPYYMFSGVKVTELDLGNWELDTREMSNEGNYACMFSGCDNLTTLTLGPNFYYGNPSSDLSDRNWSDGETTYTATEMFTASRTEATTYYGECVCCGVAGCSDCSNPVYCDQCGEVMGCDYHDDYTTTPCGFCSLDCCSDAGCGACAWCDYCGIYYDYYNETIEGTLDCGHGESSAHDCSYVWCSECEGWRCVEA